MEEHSKIRYSVISRFFLYFSLTTLVLESCHGEGRPSLDFPDKLTVAYYHAQEFHQLSRIHGRRYARTYSCVSIGAYHKDGASNISITIRRRCAIVIVDSLEVSKTDESTEPLISSVVPFFTNLSRNGRRLNAPLSCRTKIRMACASFVSASGAGFPAVAISLLTHIVGQGEILCGRGDQCAQNIIEFLNLPASSLSCFSTSFAPLSAEGI